METRRGIAIWQTVTDKLATSQHRTVTAYDTTNRDIDQDDTTVTRVGIAPLGIYYWPL